RRMRAFDELRFGAQRTLNLREGLPSADDAVRRADTWLREQQVRGVKEVLIVTGRGLHSIGGVAVVRPAVEKLLFRLRRRGVIVSHQEHNPGAFAVQIAPLRSLVEAPARNRDVQSPAPGVDIVGLEAETIDLLRTVAERSLDDLGVVPDSTAIRDEMHRYLSIISRAVPGGAQREQQLRKALRAALE